MATPGALNAFAATGENPINFIVRHMNLDTGSLGADDQLQNIRAVREGTRVLGLRIAGRHSHLDLHRSGSLRDHHPAARGVLARLQFDRRGSRLSGHHGFDVNHTERLFVETGLRPITQRRFELGFNRLDVFDGQRDPA